MDYTRADANVVHVGTGRRMHQDTSPVTTAQVARDWNGLIWSVMAVLEAAGISPAEFNADDATSYTRLRDAVEALGGPVGEVRTGLWRVPPARHLEVAGQLLQRAEYPRLWAAVQDAALEFATEAAWAAGGADLRAYFTQGDGMTTFRLPDWRGLSARWWDHGRGLDTGRGLGSYQADALQNVTGKILVTSGGHSGTGAFALEANNVSGHITAGVAGTLDDLSFDASRVARTAAETRIKSVALMVCIKY